MKNHPPLHNGCFYHIYGSGVDKCEVFRESEDFERFIIDYQRYIDTIAETYAWCLMPNHFHFLLRIKEESEIKLLSELDLTEIFKTSDKTTKSNSHIRVTKTPSTASTEKDVFKPPLAENSAGLTVEPPPGSATTGGVGAAFNHVL
jgi:putative transposase